MNGKTPVSATDRTSRRAGVAAAFSKDGAKQEPDRGSTAEEFAHWFYWTVGYASVKNPKKKKLEPIQLFPRPLL